MASLVGSLTLAIAMSSTSGIFFNRNSNNHVLPPLPGNGAGFMNGNPDGYGWYDVGDRIPLTADRTSDYFFRRYFSVPASQAFFPTYYNPYVTRGQRFIPFTGCGGPHPASGPPKQSAELPVHPHADTVNNSQPAAAPPNFSGRVEAAPVSPGSTGLRP